MMTAQGFIGVWADRRPSPARLLALSGRDAPAAGARIKLLPSRVAVSVAVNGRPGLLPAVGCPVILGPPLRRDHAPQAAAPQLTEHLRGSVRKTAVCSVDQRPLPRRLATLTSGLFRCLSTGHLFIC